MQHMTTVHSTGRKRFTVTTYCSALNCITVNYYEADDRVGAGREYGHHQHELMLHHFYMWCREGCAADYILQ